jgi:hypothetical protein
VKRFDNSQWVFLLLLALIALGVNGCTTTEPENASARPWNSPAGWQTGGLPSSINEGR